MSPTRSILGSAILVLCGAAAELQSQSFPDPGDFLLIDYTGQAEDYVIPAVDPPVLLRITAKGGAGGRAFAGEDGTSSSCMQLGGRGAWVQATFAVGTGAGELLPGGELRFIVGEKGPDTYYAEDVEGASGGGGGGTGVLYRPSAGGVWEPLVVAGAGGGAAQYIFFGSCGVGSAGGDASFTTSGDSGNYEGAGAGGTNGNGGTWGELSSGGGGLWTGSACFQVDGGQCFPPYEWLLAQAGYPAGGLGGGQGVEEGTGSGRGGFGCGGGGYGERRGGGGGGGGYSGGGGGGKDGSKWGGGGGGGSFVASGALDVDMMWQNGTADGFAVLHSVIVYDGEDCTTPVDIPFQDGSSWTDANFTVGRLASALVGCAPAGGPDMFYRYQNTSSCTQELVIEGLLVPAPHVVEAWGACSNGAFLGCSPIGPTIPPFSVLVPAGSTVLLRVLPAIPQSVGGSFTLQVTAHATASDADGDGVLDCVDNCPGFNPDQADMDGDGIGDLCDSCPMTDNSIDTDLDGVPDGCDLCPGSDDAVDSDGDGVPDGCDICMGDDGQDSDGDGLPDDCDPTPYSPAALDCDGNQFADDATDYEGRYEAFPGLLGDGSPAPAFYTLNANAAAHPVATGGVMRLAETGVQNQLASMIFEPVTTTPTDFLKVHFDVRMGPGTGLGGDGLSFSLLDPAIHGPDALFNEDGARNASLDISFDTYQNTGEPGDNFIEVAYDGVVLVQAPTFFDLEGEAWLRVELIVSDSGLLWLSLFELAPTFVHQPLFVALPVPGWEAKAWRYGFGTRTGADTNQVLLDNVLFQALDDVGDCNGDGVPDACEQTSTMLGPETALAGTGGVAPVLSGAGDLCSGNWTRVSLSQALPGSLAYIFVGGSQLSAPFMGGLLVPTPDLIELAPTGPGAFEVVFPWFSGLPTGFSLWLQAWVIDPGAPFGASASNGLRLTTP